MTASTGLAVTFVFGTLTIFTTIVRFACLKIGTGQENLVCKLTSSFTSTDRVVLCPECDLVANYDLTDPLSMLEMALAITVVALPGLKPLVGRRARRDSDVDEETVHVTHDQKNQLK